MGVLECRSDGLETPNTQYSSTPILYPFATDCSPLEAISMPHLAPDGSVEGLFKMLTYFPCMLRFIIGPRLALERDLKF